METVIILTGGTVGGVFETAAQTLCRTFERAGFEAIGINFAQGDGMARLQTALTGKSIYFVLGFVGLAGGLEVTTDGKKKNFWELGEVPYMGLHGDTPAYYFDRHINGYTGAATLYTFREHYEFRKRMPYRQGMFAVPRLFLFDREPEESMDFSAKEKGKLFFLKNGLDPQALRSLWKVKFPHSIAAALLELGDTLESRMHSEVAPDIDALTVAYFKAKNVDITEIYKLRMMFVAQLDDYLRRVKSTFMAQVLRQFPVEIHGVNWEHIDFSGKPCNFVPRADYAVSRTNMKTALGVIDMSPNTTSNFHDRPLRAMGMHTLCVTNEQESFTETFGADLPATFCFEKESLEQRINDVLTHPKRYVEAGREMTKIFDKKYPEECFVADIVGLADALRVGSLKHHISGMQEFFVWPPESIQ